MREDDLQDMRQLSLFEGVGQAYVDSLLRNAFVQRFPAHVELVHEGDPADFLYVIVQGQVEIYAGYRDRETTISVLGPETASSSRRCCWIGSISNPHAGSRPRAYLCCRRRCVGRASRKMRISPARSRSIWRSPIAGL